MNTTLKKILPLAMAAFLAGGCAAKNAPRSLPRSHRHAHAPADGSALDAGTDDHAAHIRRRR